jgi:hypothetical protein
MPILLNGCSGKVLGQRYIRERERELIIVKIGNLRNNLTTIQTLMKKKKKKKKKKIYINKLSRKKK